MWIRDFTRRYRARFFYCTVSVVELLLSIVPPSEALILTVIGPRQVSEATGKPIERLLDSLALKDIRADANTVSLPQLETVEPVIVYLFFPDEQFVTLTKTPTPAPASVVVVVVLNLGVSTIAHPVDPPPPLPPLPRWANNDIDMSARHTNTKATLIKQFFILPPQLNEVSFRSSGERYFVSWMIGDALEWLFD